MNLVIYTTIVWLIIILGAQFIHSKWQVPRLLVWFISGLVLWAMERLHADTHYILRMVVLCTTMLALMKGVVYAEWTRQTGGKLTCGRWLMFAILWFGMDPAAWKGARRKLSWKGDFAIGVSCLLIGWVICIVLVKLGVTNIIIVFIPMSMAFHFGALRLLTAFWRRCGFPVRTLFRNPLASKGLADFWSARWNLSFSQMMARAVKRPIDEKLGQKAAVFTVFLASGLLHELAITIPVKAGYGMPFLYFLIHGMMVLLEKDSWPLWLKRGLTLLFVVAPLPLLFPDVFTNEIILPFLKMVAGDLSEI
ncbi:MAG: MBOAT family protein [Akkermansiaceae bacterium]